ncbi:MAG TPA: TIGR02186 family protein [Alphaproteobacteria bacterium]|nr:TIGR02186 family protein [Alphaproteobacteria bacterium]
MRRTARIAALILWITATVATSARAQSLAADLSSHVIGITTGFAGADLVLFGSADRQGDVAVVVRGPPTTIVVRRKTRILGVWLNGRSATFRDAPSFYEAAATKPLTEIATPETLVRYGIGLDNLRFQLTETTDPTEFSPFRAALLRAQERTDLYRPDLARVSFLGEHLFRADIVFPANLPTGDYTVEVVLLSGGQVISAQTTPLIVSRVGFSNGVFAVAHHHSVLYGTGALALAIAAGWAAGAIFRRM